MTKIINKIDVRRSPQRTNCGWSRCGCEVQKISRIQELIEGDRKSLQFRHKHVFVLQSGRCGESGGFPDDAERQTLYRLLRVQNDEPERGRIVQGVFAMDFQDG